MHRNCVHSLPYVARADTQVLSHNKELGQASPATDGGGDIRQHSLYTDNSVVEWSICARYTSPKML